MTLVTKTRLEPKLRMLKSPVAANTKRNHCMVLSPGISMEWRCNGLKKPDQTIGDFIYSKDSDSETWKLAVFMTKRGYFMTKRGYVQFR